MKTKYEKPAIESKEVFERMSAVVCLVSQRAGVPTCEKETGMIDCAYAFS